MKILVTGFQRSGTTMTRRLMTYHPNVSHILHERKLLKKKRTKQDIIKYANALGIKDPLNSNWGDKVPFYDNKPGPQVNYIRRWNEIWGKEARSIYLVRHPIDIAISTVRVKMEPNIKVVIKRQNTSVPQIVEMLKDIDQVLIVSFESLVTNPKDVLKEMFKFCSLDYSDKVVDMVASAKTKQLRYFDNINADRAFAYKKQTDLKVGVKHYDYDKLRSLYYVI